MRGSATAPPPELGAGERVIVPTGLSHGVTRSTLPKRGSATANRPLDGLPLPVTVSLGASHAPTPYTLGNHSATRGSAIAPGALPPGPVTVSAGAPHAVTDARRNFSRRFSSPTRTPGRSRQSPPAGINASRTQFFQLRRGTLCIGPAAATSPGIGSGPSTSPHARTRSFVGS